MLKTLIELALLLFDNKLILNDAQLTSGKHRLELRRKGSGPVYFNAYLNYFSLEDHITKAGLEIKVERRYYKLVRKDSKQKVVGSHGQVLSQKVEKYDRIPLDNLASVTSGDLIEVELEIISKNDYEYIMFEDQKAAGLEAVKLRSGYTGPESFRCF